MSDAHDAIEISAGAFITGDAFSRQTASPAQISKARRIIRLFLENMDDSLTVLEVKEQLESRLADD